jgi:Mg-chelatase subunit ChlI
VPVPVVDLPLGVTEDRVVGALDLEKALTRGIKVFEPGLLARAHRGFLYIDEVNLLEDHLVDLLLDVAASGENLVEREGLSLRHPARFVLVGSGNPEEGELRPQLLDRFGLSVDVRSPSDLSTRVAVVRRRDVFERDPAAFVREWEKETSRLRSRIVAARRRLPGVDFPDSVLEAASRLCLHLGVDGPARRAHADARRPRRRGARRRAGGRPRTSAARCGAGLASSPAPGSARRGGARRCGSSALSARSSPRKVRPRERCAPRGRTVRRRSGRHRRHRGCAAAGDPCATNGWRRSSLSCPSGRPSGACRRASPTTACWAVSDLAATLQARRPVIERGLLAEADGGIILLPMAERLTSSAVARLTAVLDTGEVVVERDGIAARHAARLGVVAFDEGDWPG